ncbi:ThiF family adenylyltransferase [Pseudonocardia lacus]|uniref:ThiF family adenylyltransferase n=1 Tax=Pseudonocardia lacus TaxID=2835865 RepID=UPI001BDD4A59|nr:ThiF family adenylyltransferase [Pseudonocardia lacus]
MTSDSRLDTSRIDYLLANSGLTDSKIVIAGLGSGGIVVLERLAMTGIKRWSLFDPDVLTAVNLVKHPARRCDIGRLKTDIAADWLVDRNPECKIDHAGGDVFDAPGFADEVGNADLVVCAVDNAAARSFVNEVCVEKRSPCVFGSVFRTGLGGEVFAYLPGETGCYNCMRLFSLEQGRDIENWLDLTDEETQRIYGVGQADFTASGLAADIAVIASLHAHYITALLGSGNSDYLTAPSFNWLTVALRRVNGLFPTMYETTRMLLRPQARCHLRCGAPGLGD